MSDFDDVLNRFAQWPDHAKAEFIGIAREIDAEVHRGEYVATPEELVGIDRGLADLAKGNVVGLDAIERLIKKHRPE